MSNKMLATAFSNYVTSQTHKSGLMAIALEEIADICVLANRQKVDPEIRDQLNLIQKIARKARRGEEWFLDLEETTK